ncbi:biliverdin-producing heme oxygenase [Nocardioides sp. MAHUQ-72]|uniref:biliverdin-producing heme oxygenase n=1 Tax=unclassified Nocardioides TaxID=2615069 RepID=UPI00361DE2CF
MLPAEDPTPLSIAMREGSRADHERAEAAGFVADLMAGRMDPERYAAYLRRLQVVYTALERAVGAHRAHPAVSAVHDASLCRSDALERDLAHWSAACPGPASPRTTSPAAAAYRVRIELAGERPHLLVAHHYTRYLGDLSGGRMLAQALRRSHPGLADGGLAFYDFADIAKPVAYKRAYRAQLDALPVDPAERVEVVEEVRHAFDLNRRLLDELSAADQAPALCP